MGTTIAGATLARPFLAAVASPMRRAADSTEPGRARPCPAVLRGVMGARRDDLLSEGGVGADRAREDEAAAIVIPKR